MSTNKFLTLINGVYNLVTAINTSTGSSDGNKIIATRQDTGTIDESLLPSGLGVSVASMVASEGLSAGDFINIWSDSGTRKARKADSSNNRPANGFVLVAVTANSNASVVLQGLNTALSGLSIGSIYYLGTSGGITTTAPTTTNHIVQNLGFVANTTSLFFEFNEPIIMG